MSDFDIAIIKEFFLVVQNVLTQIWSNLGRKKAIIQRSAKKTKNLLKIVFIIHYKMATTWFHNSETNHTNSDWLKYVLFMKIWIQNLLNHEENFKTK